MLNTQQIIAEADRCVACGLCLPHCPTYYKTGSEADSPRGRIQLISAVTRDILPANARYQAHIDGCLSCRNCETACPNGVQYGALIDSARANIAQLPNTKSANLSNIVLIHLACSPVYMRLAGMLLKLAQKLRLLSALKQIPALKKPISLLPPMPVLQTWRALYKTKQTKKGEVSLFLGCISKTFDTDTLRASVYVLNQLGFDVLIPKAQTCCGGLARQLGNTNWATQNIATNDSAFNKTLPVLTVASGCGAGLHDYSELNVQDISAFLNQCDWQDIKLKPLADEAMNEILVHEPCTLRNVQKTHTAVVELLKKIPQANIANLSGNAQCCGGAGAYMLSQPSMADTLLSDKISAVKKTNTKLLATSNIGCVLHIAAGLREQDIAVKVLHPVSIIAKQMGFTGRLD